MSTTVTAPADKADFLAAFNRLEKELARHGRPALQRLRKAAIARFNEVGFPTARTEDWRFTSVTPLVKTPFEFTSPADRSLSAGRLREILGMDVANCLVFVNGVFARELSATPDLPNGVIAGSLAEALDKDPETVESHLAKYARFEDLPFTALNTALFRDGAFVVVPRGKLVEAPLHLIFVTTTSGTALAVYPRNLIVLGSGSQATLVESYVGSGEAVYLTNPVTEIVVGDGAVVDHYKVQRESSAAFHVANTQIRMDQSSNFTSHFLSFGGRLVRNEVRALLDAEGCECTLNGLYLATGRQHVDNHTVIDHAKPHCASHELYKGILDGHGQGVFNGKIFVRQDAQKTDAKQTNQTLLLSDDATINTKPQLEIFADDVKCTHGATVGQLDAEATFYLQTRGIGKDEARSLLTYAFANDVVSRVKVAAVREGLEQALLAAQGLPAAEGDAT
jgi:Fe-S cluster assembly protein SufD